MKALELGFSNADYGSKISKMEWETDLFKPVVESINFGMWDYTVFRYLLPIKNNSNSDIQISSITNHTDAYYIETLIKAKQLQNQLIEHAEQLIS